MIPTYYAHFKVKIIDKVHCAGDDILYPATAVVSFYNDKNEFISARDFGYLTTKQVYEKIDDEKSINLNNCYVHNFSITAYRRTRLLDKNQRIEIEGLSAKNAFFNSKYTIDFSYIQFSQSAIDFSGAHFANGDLLFHQSRFGNGDVDFSYSVVRSKNVDFSNCIFGKGAVSFKNAVFYKGSKNFQYTDFGTGELSFVNTEFGGGEVAFLNTNFNTGKVSFKVARFGNGRVHFHFAKFGAGDISFERTDFGNGPVDFRTAEFGSGKVNFNRARFGEGDVSFEASSAQGRVTFKKTVFANGAISFDLAEFEQTELNMEKAIFGDGNLSFLNGMFKHLTLSGCHINNYLDIRVQSCPVIDLSDTVVRDIIDFKPFDSDVKVEVLNISGMRLLGIIYIDWKQNQVEKMIRGQENTTLEEKSEQFRILKESFNQAGQYEDEDAAYVLFKRFELLSRYKRKVSHAPVKKMWEYPIYLSKKLVVDDAGLYATDPFRVMISMGVTYVFFSLVYALVLFFNLGGIVSGIGGEHSLIGILGRSFYHSGITFLTIGYGDFYPLGAIRWLSNVEGFIGVFLMSYFTVAFVRKILR